MQRGVTVSLMFHYNEPFLRNKKKKTKKQRRQWDQKKREINVPISDVVKYIKKTKEAPDRIIIIQQQQTPTEN